MGRAYVSFPYLLLEGFLLLIYEITYERNNEAWVLYKIFLFFYSKTSD